MDSLTDQSRSSCAGLDAKLNLLTIAPHAFMHLRMPLHTTPDHMRKSGVVLLRVSRVLAPHRVDEAGAKPAGLHTAEGQHKKPASGDARANARLTRSNLVRRAMAGRQHHANADAPPKIAKRTVLHIRAPGVNGQS